MQIKCKVKTKYILMAALALLLYYAEAYYVGWRLFDLLIRPQVQPLVTWLYWIIYVFAAASYFLGRVGQVFFASRLSNWLIQFGAYWLGLFFYTLLFLGLFDTGLYVFARIGVLPPEYEPSWSYGLTILGIAVAVFGYGVWNARRVRLRRHIITIYKECRVREMHIAAVSDVHLGLLVGKDRLETLVDQVNQLKPDAVLLLGDIFDENIGTFRDSGMPPLFRRIQARYGVFACLGSHEYIWGHSEKSVAALRSAGIVTLQDEVAKLPNDVYIIGRDDSYRMNLTDSPRQSLRALLKDCDQSLPLIVLDHYPGLAESRDCEVDLQLSGHTHGGQLFPVNLITSFYFELNKGYMRQGSFQALVSSGYGTWLLPVRVGTVPEILSIQLIFRKPGN